MSKQTEKEGVSPESLAATLGFDSAEGLRCSGGQIENFRAGWAIKIMPFGSKRSHLFKRDGFDGAKALCGVLSSVRWLYGEGNYQRCARCAAAALGEQHD
jgi:hypothetical protein